MREVDDFHWARRVPRRKVQRLYESDAAGMLDVDLLDDVGFGTYARCRDMFEVRRAIEGQVTCRNCGALFERRGWEQVGDAWIDPKSQTLVCRACNWHVTWGEYYDSYTGNRMLPGSATEVFADFTDRWPKARTPMQKLQLIDWMIHEFHVNQGIDGRPVGENVISGTRQQVIALIESLAYGDASTVDGSATAAWRLRLNDPVRRFRQAHSWAKTQTIARELGIPAPDRTDDQNAIVAEILRLDPSRLEL